MWCKSCSKDVGISELAPSVERCEVRGGVVYLTVKMADLCEDCYSELASVRLEMERKIPPESGLDLHLEHSLSAEVESLKRMPDNLPNHIGAEAKVKLSCAGHDAPGFTMNMSGSELASS